MTKRFRGPGGGMPDMQGLIKQAQRMQEQLGQTKRDLEGFRAEAQAGGGAVRVTLDNKCKVVSLDISPEIVDPQDVEVLRDTLVAALNEAADKVQAHVEAELGKATGGFNIPGLF